MSKSDFSKVKASLPAPLLPDAKEGTISLKDIPNGMRFGVSEYPGIETGHVVTCRFGYAGDDFPYDEEYVVENPTSFELVVPRKVLLDLTGKTAIARYWVKKMDGSYLSSSPTTVKVTH